MGCGRAVCWGWGVSDSVSLSFPSLSFASTQEYKQTGGYVDRKTERELTHRMSLQEPLIYEVERQSEEEPVIP